jgi:hypothetical protein
MENRALRICRSPVYLGENPRRTMDVTDLDESVYTSEQMLEIARNLPLYATFRFASATARCQCSPGKSFQDKRIELEIWPSGRSRNPVA